MKKAVEIFKIGAKYSFKNPITYIMLVIFNILATIVYIYIPTIQGDIINVLTYDRDKSKFIAQLYMIAFLLVLNVLFPNLKKYLSDKTQNISAYLYMKDITAYLHKSSMAYLSSHDSAYFSSRLEEATFSCLSFFRWDTINLLKILITIAYPFYIITKTNYKLAIALIIIIFCNFLNYKVVKKAIYKKEGDFQEKRAEYFAFRKEQFSSLKFIKSHGLYTLFIDKMDKIFNMFLKSYMKKVIVDIKYLSLLNVISILSNIIVYVSMGIAVLNGDVTLGIFSMIIQYAKITTKSVEDLFDIGTIYQKSKVSFDKISEFMQVYSHKDGKEELNDINSIQVENLNFDYGDKTIFKNYSLILKYGEIYGLNGENGAGKSTLLDIILGHYMGDYTGKISYNGIDINKINLTKCKQKLIGVTEQEPLLMKDTLYNNICLGEKYDKDKIYECAKIVGLSEYFAKLPDGLETEINDKSTNISGGEKQKISILRQLLKNPDVMIFDEPTSALDKASVELFLDHIQKIKNDKLIIIISHDERVKQIYDETIIIKKSEIEVLI